MALAGIGKHHHQSGTTLDDDNATHHPYLPAAAVSLGIFLFLWILYAAIGYQTTVNAHVVVFDALDRLSRAYLVWHNDPPKLAAIGFFYPPLATAVFLPLAIIAPLATGLTAMPITSAFFAAGTIVILDRALARCDMVAIVRYSILAVFAANPLWLFYSGNGMSEAVYSCFLAICLYFFVSWYTTAEPQFLIGAGITIAILIFVRYGFMIWALLLAVLIGVALTRRAAARTEVEGSVIAFAAPMVYGLGLWIVINTLIVGDPLGWLSANATSQAVNSTGLRGLGALSFNEVATRLLQLNISVFPLAFLAVPGLVLAFVRQRNDMALWLASLIVIGVIITGGDAILTGQESLLTLRDSFPMMITAVIGIGWLYRTFVRSQKLIWIATIIILVAGWGTAWYAMKNYPFQSLEQAYTRTLFTGKSQEGTSSRGGYTVGIDPEAQMAAYIKKNVSGHDVILTDNSKTYGVILLNGQPDKYFLRVDKGDGVWMEKRDEPWGIVKYFLVTNNLKSGDLIDKRYPLAKTGKVPGLTPIYATQRYTLIRVADQQPGTRSTKVIPKPSTTAPTMKKTTTTTTVAPTTPTSATPTSATPSANTSTSDTTTPSSNGPTLQNLAP